MKLIDFHVITILVIAYNIFSIFVHLQIYTINFAFDFQLLNTKNVSVNNNNNNSNNSKFWS